MFLFLSTNLFPRPTHAIPPPPGRQNDLRYSRKVRAFLARTARMHRDHGKKVLLYVLCFCAGTLALLGLISLTHIFVNKHYASIRLGNTMAIIEHSEFHLIRNGLYDLTRPPPDKEEDYLPDAGRGGGGGGGKRKLQEDVQGLEKEHCAATFSMKVTLHEAEVGGWMGG